MLGMSCYKIFRTNTQHRRLFFSLCNVINLKEKEDQQGLKGINNFMKNMIILLICFATSISSFSQKKMSPLQQRAPTTNKKCFSIDDSLIDKVFELKEIKNLISYEEKLPDSSKSKIAVMLIQKPTAKNPYYYFKAGYNEPDIFFTIYQFRLNSKFKHENKLDKYINILVESTEKFIPLSIWEKTHIPKS
jgi:hypothetical protein